MQKLRENVKWAICEWMYLKENKKSIKCNIPHWKLLVSTIL
jgi:hypothetical protein